MAPTVKKLKRYVCLKRLVVVTATVYSRNYLLRVFFFSTRRQKGRKIVVHTHMPTTPSRIPSRRDVAVLTRIPRW